MGMKSSVTTSVTGNVLVLVKWEDPGNAAKTSPVPVASASLGTCPDACSGMCSLPEGALMDAYMVCVADISDDNIGTDDGVR